MTTGLKPSWQGLKAPLAGFSNPVEEVVGQFVDWRLESDTFGNTQVIFRLSGCQILNSDTPFPYPDWELAIKFSEHEVSAWGFFGVSAAEALGTSIELLDIDLLKGRWAHILRSAHDYGPDKSKPETSPGVPARMMGMVYRIVRFIQPGEAVQSIAPPKIAAPATTTQSAVAATNSNPPAAVTMPAAQVMAVPTAQSVVHTPAVLMPTQAPLVPPVAEVQAAPTATVAATPAPSTADLSPEDQALSLLHGKDNASFFAVAIPDPIIRTDANLVNAIMSGVFIQAKITSGQITLNDDGTYTVVGKS